MSSTTPATFLGTHASEVLPELLRAALEAPHQPSRNGSTNEIRFAHVTLTKPRDRAITTLGRKAALPAQIAETMWILAGRNDVEFLGHYLPRAKDFSDDGDVWRGGYGPRIRKWGGWPHQNQDGKVGFDQLAFVVDLLKRDPGTRRAIINIYDPTVDSQDGKDIPCNDWLHFMARGGVLDLHVATRSNDIMWGWSGINAFEWSVLLEIVAKLAGGFEVGEIHFSISSLHLYSKHRDKAQRIVQAADSSDEHRRHEPVFGQAFSPRICTVERLDDLVQQWFEAEQIIREGSRNKRDTWTMIDDFPEPMMREWLWVLQYYWRGDEQALLHSVSNHLAEAAKQSPKRKFEEPVTNKNLAEFQDEVIALHLAKHAAYGDSWKKRGEMVSILANVARKVDRLAAGGETPDESQSDTAIDLWVYLRKYAVWLRDQAAHTALSDEAESINPSIRSFAPSPAAVFSNKVAIDEIEETFEKIISLMVFSDDYTNRLLLVDQMSRAAGTLAYRYWWAAKNQKRAWAGYGDE